MSSKNGLKERIRRTKQSTADKERKRKELAKQAKRRHFGGAAVSREIAKIK